MANQSKLKAWVRYNGTGRVISGGPIFQVNKPKVGNWKQIDANLCCNSTLTTTTTQGGGGVTPTAWVGYGAYNPYYACQGTGGWNLLLYTSTSTLTNGVVFYSDAALSVPYNSNSTGSAIAINGTLYGLGDNGGSTILAVMSCNPFTTTSTTTQAPVLNFIGRVGSTSSAACNGVNVTLYTTGPLIANTYPQNGIRVYFDEALTQFVTDLFVSSPGIGSVWNCTDGVLSNQANC